MSAKVGCSGHVIGTRPVGPSAPLKPLQTTFALEPDQVAVAAKELPGTP
jgi:hypothetical protein